MLFFALMIGLGMATPILQPQISSGERYSESYTLSADLSDGSFLLFQILFFNFGFGDGNAACRILYVSKEGQGINRKEKYSNTEWVYTSATDRLEVGPCVVQQSSRVQISATVDDIDMKITMGTRLQKVRFPGERDVPGRIFQSSVLLNGAELSGKLNGRSISGRAYMDHNRSDAIIKDVGSLWVRYRGMYGTEPMLFQVYTDASGVSHAWHWHAAQAGPATLSMSNTVEMNRISPEGIHVRVQDIDIHSQRTVFVYNPIEEIGVFGKIAENLVGNPSTITYDAKATKNDQVLSEGVLEVTFFE